MLWLTGMGICADSPEASSDIPDVLVPFDSENGKTEYMLIVEKATQTLFLYEYNGSFREIRRFNCSTGKSPGAKMREGDKKTPEGVYFFVKRFEKEELTALYGELAGQYGIRAFATDYPNLSDRMEGKTGDAIWLHGTNKPLKPMDTQGCVALENADVDTLSGYITFHRTPIIITEKLSFKPANTVVKEDVLRLMAQWNTALAQGTYHEYLTAYDEEYLPDISWWTEWKKIRKKHQASGDSVNVQSKNLSLFRHGDTIVAVFDQTVHVSGSEAPTGTRKLMLAYRNNALRIVSDEYQVIAPIPETTKLHPIVAAVRSIKGGKPSEKPSETPSEPADDREITVMLDEWISAWTSRNIDRYGAFYADDFYSQDMKLKEWLDHKKRLNQQYSFIRVSKENVKIQRDQNRATVSFLQTYESPGYKAVGMKQLELKQESGKWKIYRETWRKL